MSSQRPIPSVNFHLWQPCNMRCKFCFATFQDGLKQILPKGHLPRREAIQVVERLAPAFKKINFAGGEPTLCPWLPALIERAKELGMTTSIVTNGSRLSDWYLDDLYGSLDWVTLSIDSLSALVNKNTGRALRRGALTEDYYRSLVRSVKERGYRLKINTVVTDANRDEDMAEFIRWAKSRSLEALPGTASRWPE